MRKRLRWFLAVFAAAWRDNRKQCSEFEWWEWEDR